MRLKRLEIAGFKSFAKKTTLSFDASITAIVGPNGSGKSNVAEAFRFALGEQSMKSMRGKRGEDLIWNGSAAVPRANRASVKIVFDNSDRALPFSFDEVVVERTVFRDGVNEYRLNDSVVRLKDVTELLARAHIGETSHHIISQGEADRILLSAPRERRAMVEEALGLSLYKFRIAESQKKLEKTLENMAQVEVVRREIQPHLRFLKKQVEKAERVEGLKVDLREKYREYFAYEEAYLAHERRAETSALARAEKLLAEVESEDVLLRKDLLDTSNTPSLDISKLETELRSFEEKRTDIARELGRIEGVLSETEVVSGETVAVSRKDIDMIASEARRARRDSEEAKDASALASILSALSMVLEQFTARYQAVALSEGKREKLAKESEFLRDRASGVESEIARIRSSVIALRNAHEAEQVATRDIERRTYELSMKRGEAESEKRLHTARLREIQLLSEEFEREHAEAIALVGREGVSYTPLAEPGDEDRRAQEDRKRTIERMKIRIEEAGGAGDEVIKEYTDVSARDTFLARELADLAQSADSLRSVIADLERELGETFNKGFGKINTAFSEFFSLMFGGGSARLTLIAPRVEREDEELSEEDTPTKDKDAGGIDVSVSLPRKRIQGLMQLSGGERALTSIALIFAMSQVNPPPFLILDETDAALDEANSRRYGDMIENLAQRSGLIVITHNRESMSRAGILYGVTMGGDGLSRLLSVKFEEAVAVAK